MKLIRTLKSSACLLTLSAAFLTVGSTHSQAASALGAYLSGAFDPSPTTGVLGEQFVLFGPSGYDDSTTIGVLGLNTITLSIDGAGGSSGTNQTAPISPFRGYVYGDNLITMTLSGLDANTQYNVAAYSGSGGNLTQVTLPDGTFGTLSSIGNDGLSFVQATSTNGYAGNYITSIVTSDSNGHIAVTYALPGSNPIVSGIGVSIVPEPSTYLLFGTGVLVLCFFGRRKLA